MWIIYLVSAMILFAFYEFENVQFCYCRYIGILNGIDTTIWNPATDAFLPTNYDGEFPRPIIIYLHIQ